MPLTLITGPANAGKAQLVLDAVRAPPRARRGAAAGRADARRRRALPARARRRRRGDRRARRALRRADRGDRAPRRHRRAGARRARARAAARSARGARLGGEPSRRGFVRALGGAVRRAAGQRASRRPRLVAALDSWARPTAPARRGSDARRLSTPLPARAARGSAGSTPSSARCARSTRCASARRCGAARRSCSTASTTSRRCSSTRSRRSARVVDARGHRVAALRARPRRRSPGARRRSRRCAAGRASTTRCRRAPSTTRPARAPRSRHLERSLFEPDARARRPRRGGAAARGRRRARRARAGRRARSRRCSRGGVPAEEIAVARASPAGTSLELLAEVFAAAAIPFALQRRRPFARHARSGARCSGCCAACPGRDGARAGRARATCSPGCARPGLLEQPGARRLRSSSTRAARGDARRRAGARAAGRQRHWPLEAIDRLARGRSSAARRALLERAARELLRLFARAARAAARACSAPRSCDEARALAAGRARAGASCASWRASRPSWRRRRAAELAEVLERARASTAASCRGRARRRARPARAARAARAGAVRLRPAGGRLPARARARSRCSARRSGGGSREASGLRLGEQRGRCSPPSATCSTRRSRGRGAARLSWHATDDDGRADVALAVRRRRLRPVRRGPARASARAARSARVDGPRAGCQRAGAASAPAAQPAARRARARASCASAAWSASSLERWIGCPVAWFVERLLRPERFEPEPEPLARGGLAHAALKDTLEGLRARDRQRAASRRADARSCAASCSARRSSANDAEHPLSVAPERRAIVRRRLRRRPRALPRARRPRAESPLEPRELELGFGFAGERRARRGRASCRRSSSAAACSCAGGSTASTSAPAARRSSIDYKGARPRRAAASGSRTASCRSRSTCSAVEQLLGRARRRRPLPAAAGSDLRARGVLDGDAAARARLRARPTCASPTSSRELLGAALATRARGGRARRPAARCEPRPGDVRAGRAAACYPTICRCER